MSGLIEPPSDAELAYEEYVSRQADWYRKQAAEKEQARRCGSCDHGTWFFVGLCIGMSVVLLAFLVLR
jgi:hypothetical protein